MSKLDVKDWIIIVLAVLLLIAGICCGIFYSKYEKAEHEVVIWNDSTYIYKNKYNEEYEAKNTYILEVDQLKKYNQELYDEYKSLKDNPLVITKTVVVTKIDTVPTNTINAYYNDSILNWAWQANDGNYYVMAGESRADLIDPNKSQTTIHNVEVNGDITLDVIDNGEQLSVIAKTDNPYINIGDMESVVIDPATSPTIKNYFKPKRWGFGPYVGVGLNVGYDLINKGVGVNVGASFGFSFHYDLIQW